jgi:hypothetical protein
MKWNNIKVPSLGHIYKQIKKVLLENLETDYVLILEDMKKQRSTEISTHFHSHVTYIYRYLFRAGIEVTRLKIYFDCLLLACEMQVTEGASEYPYTIIDGVLYPKPTKSCSNKQVMQAVEATHRYASVIVVEKYGLEEGIILPEKEEVE